MFLNALIQNISGRHYNQTLQNVSIASRLNGFHHENIVNTLGTAIMTCASWVWSKSVILVVYVHEPSHVSYMLRGYLHYPSISSVLIVHSRTTKFFRNYSSCFTVRILMGFFFNTVDSRVKWFFF